MAQDIPADSSHHLPSWVEESLVKQLRSQFPDAPDVHIIEALKRSAEPMQQTLNLAALLAAATAILRGMETSKG